jgi:hypothetical protein
MIVKCVGDFVAGLLVDDFPFFFLTLFFFFLKRPIFPIFFAFLGGFFGKARKKRREKAGNPRVMLNGENVPSFEAVNRRMYENAFGARFSQLSPKGLGYIILRLGTKIPIDEDLLSIFRVMATSENASDVFGRFNRERDDVVPDKSRRSLFLKHKRLKKTIRASLKGHHLYDNDKTVDRVFSFFKAFQDCLKDQQFFQDLKRNYKSLDEKDNHVQIAFSIMMTSLLGSQTQVEHSDYNPTGSFQVASFMIHSIDNLYIFIFFLFLTK